MMLKWIYIITWIAYMCLLIQMVADDNAKKINIVFYIIWHIPILNTIMLAVALVDKAMEER